MLRLMLACVCFSILLSAGLGNKEPSAKRNMVNFLNEYLDIKYPDIELDTYIYVAVKHQKLYLISDDRVVAEHQISTAKNGIGTEKGSLKTPTGLHLIKEKVGAGLDEGAVIKEKVPTGDIAEIRTQNNSSPGDIITTRLLHLEGLEEGLNKGGSNDSYFRGIMIHGTPDEGLIGQPVSHGCIRMRNKEVIELFDKITPGIHVIILNN